MMIGRRSPRQFSRMSAADRRKTAATIQHMRDITNAAREAAGQGDRLGYMAEAAHYVGHGTGMALGLRLNARGWDRFADQYIQQPARRQWERVYGADDATVSQMPAQDATSAPERDEPATVRVFPRAGRHNAQNGRHQ